MGNVKNISVGLTRKQLKELEELRDYYGETISQVVHRALYTLYFKTRVKDEIREARRKEKKITLSDQVTD